MDEAARALVVLGATMEWQTEVLRPADPGTNREARSLAFAQRGAFAWHYTLHGPVGNNGIFEVAYRPTQEDRVYLRTYPNEAAARQDCEVHAQTGTWEAGEDTTRDDRTDLKIDWNRCRGDVTNADYDTAEFAIAMGQAFRDDRSIEYELLESYPNVRMDRSVSHVVILLDGTLAGRCIFAEAVSGKDWWRSHDGTLD